MNLFDAHFHVIDLRYPLFENNGYTPDPFTVENYQSELRHQALVGGAVVSGSFQRFDQAYLLQALKELGPGYVGVANISMDTPDNILKELDLAGVRAVRFNIERGGSAHVSQLLYLSEKLHSMFGWHTELYIDSLSIPDVQPQLENLSRYSIDHLGLSKAGLPQLYSAVENGAYVKATGFGRLDFDPVPVMQQIHSINPNALMFGSDLPSTRAPIPFNLTDIALIGDNFSSDDQARILCLNALEFYRIA